MRKLLVAVLLLWTAEARAQFAAGGPDRDRPSGEAFGEDSQTKARLSVSGFYYGESASGGAMANQPPAAQQPTKQSLMYSDVRGKVEAERYSGTKWFLLGDFRLRLAPNTRVDGNKTNNSTDAERSAAARGLLGGSEYHLKEAYGEYRGDKVRLGIGRIIVREVDATRVDGLLARYTLSTSWEAGAFAGMYPSPFSRSVIDDYQTVGIGGAPVAAGAYAGYRFLRAYGNVGVAGIIPRTNFATDPVPTRVFVTMDGYTRATDVLNLFHYVAFDVTGEAGATPTNIQAIAQYRMSNKLRLEGGATYMSTYATRLFLTDFLETAQAEAGAPAINNLSLLRLSRFEVRGGVNYDFLESGAAVFGDLRYRTRKNLDTEDIPMELRRPSDTEIDVSVGARKRRAFAGTDLFGGLVVIRGGRTSSEVVHAAVEKPFLDDRADGRVGLTVIRYADQCETMDPTCQGSSSGRSLRLNLGAVWLKDDHWLFVGDYVFSYNTAKSGPAPGIAATTTEPNITAHSLFVQAQYRF